MIAAISAWSTAALPAAAGDEDGIWPSEIRRVDRENQPYERVPARLPETGTEQQAGGPPRFRLNGFVRVLDGVSFTYRNRRYRLAGVDPLPSNAICTEPDGARRACGVESRAVFATLIGKGGVWCRQVAEADEEISVECSHRDADIAGFLVAEGHAIPLLAAD